MPLKIITDSSCCLSKQVFAQKEIEIIPYMISLDGNKYMEDLFELDSTDLCNAFASGSCRPKTSTPPLDAFLNRFEKFASKGFDIIYISMTSAFTSGCDHAAIAAKEVMEEHGVKIAAIDSETVSVMEGFLVLEAVRLSEAGKCFSEIVDTLNRIKKSIGAAFILDTLSYAVKGGRLGKMGAMLGDFLNIKPVIYFKDGAMQLYSKTRTRKKAMEQIIDSVIEQTKGFIKDRVTYVAVHIEAYDDALELAARFAERTGCQIKGLPEYVCNVVGAHSGPRLIGIGFYVNP